MPDRDPSPTDLRYGPGWYAILPKPPSAKRLSGDQVADWVVVGAGVTGLAAALLTPRTVLENPAVLCRGLAETMPENVEVYEETAVHRVEPGSIVRIECTEASIRAESVVLTSNAFITRLGFLRRHVFPMIACASLSRPLRDDEQSAMGGITGVMTLRRTVSNRILVRHGLGYTGDFRLSDSRRSQLLKSRKAILSARVPRLAGLASSTPGPASSA